nr:hypothetical protein [Tanacetum cinerariifolium]
MKAFRAISKVVDSIRGDYTLQYKMLRDYFIELKECNPNTTGIIPAIVELFPAAKHRLDTWKEVYSHHINPIKGKIMWPMSNIPTIIRPPNYHPQKSASASSVKASASGSKVATQKGNKTSTSVKDVASVSKAIQPYGNVKGASVNIAGNVKGATTGSKAVAQKGKKYCNKWKRIKPGYSAIWECT